MHKVHPKPKANLLVLVYQLDLGWSSLAGFGVSNNDTASIKHKKWKTPFPMTCKLGQFDVVELMVSGKFRVFSINSIAQHVNGMTY